VNRLVGVLEAPLHSRDCFFGPSPFTDLIQNLQLQLTGADISFSAPLSFNTVIEAGNIYVRDMFKLYRFENRLYTLRMTGEEVRKHLEMSYDLWTNTMKSPEDHILLLDEGSSVDQQRYGFKNLTFNFDSATGIDYEVDVTKPAGEKVRILRMSDGRPFDPKAWYVVAMNSYRGNGGGELLTHGAGIAKDSIQNRILTTTPLDLRYYLTQEIERMGTVNPKANTNWRFVPEAWAEPALRRDRKLLFKE
jgi:2',3'-cyclic-nucleotide 2'-phosphodiesterase/3'-nucleotidase